MKISHEASSHVGRRENNEDSMLARPDLGFYAVADGMGGYEGGEVASRVALESLEAYFELLGDEGLGLSGDPQVALERMGLAIRIAHREVGRRAEGELSEMGTTVVCAVVHGDHVLLAHVGDSRVYRLRDGELERLTRDHSLYAVIESAGFKGLAQEQRSRLSSVITQALGQGPPVKPDFRVEDVLPGDRLLLCSDGLSDALDDEAIAWLMTRNADATEALVTAAYDAGGRDNITALLISVGD